MPNISTTPNPFAGGSTTGDITGFPNETRTVTATANAGFVFINWVANNVVVSTDSAFTFTLVRDIALTANFAVANNTTTTTNTSAGSNSSGGGSGGGGGGGSGGGGGGSGGGAKKAKELFEKLKVWSVDNIVKNRVENKEKGYEWCAKCLAYSDELTLKGYQKFFDRKELNTEFKKRYEETSIASKKQYGWYKAEANIIYSLHKCFAMRHQTRLQYYRHDLSQKGKRTQAAVNIAMGKMKFLRDQAEDKI